MAQVKIQEFNYKGISFSVGDTVKFSDDQYDECIVSDDRSKILKDQTFIIKNIIKYTGIPMALWLLDIGDEGNLYWVKRFEKVNTVCTSINNKRRVRKLSL